MAQFDQFSFNARFGPVRGAVPVLAAFVGGVTNAWLFMVRCGAEPQSVDEKPSSPVVVRAVGSAQVTQGEAVGDVGAVQVAGGDLGAQHARFVAAPEQLGSAWHASYEQAKVAGTAGYEVAVVDPAQLADQLWSTHTNAGPAETTCPDPLFPR